jgi:membrane protein DedA with SNARE-associated domain
MIELFINLIKIFSYFGFFLIGFISSSTIFLPFPIYVISTLSIHFGYNPILVAFLTSLGMSFGELTGYFVGFAGYKAYEKIEKNKYYKKFKGWFKKHGDATIFIFAFLPLPFDIVGIACGMSKYSIKKFLLFTFFGKFLKMLLIAYGFYEAKKLLF